MWAGKARAIAATVMVMALTAVMAVSALGQSPAGPKPPGPAPIQQTQDFFGITKTEPITIQPDAQWVDVATVRARNSDDEPAAAVIDGTVSARNAYEKPADLELRVVVDGKPEPATFASTVPAAGRAATVGAFVCNGLPPGEHTAVLQARVFGANPVVLDSQTLTSLRPIFNPPT